MATRLALLVGRRRSVLTIVSVAAALAGAKVGAHFHVAGFFDG